MKKANFIEERRRLREERAIRRRGAERNEGEGWRRGADREKKAREADDGGAKEEE